MKKKFCSFFFFFLMLFHLVVFLFPFFICSHFCFNYATLNFLTDRSKRVHCVPSPTGHSSRYGSRIRVIPPSWCRDSNGPCCGLGMLPGLWFEFQSCGRNVSEQKKAFQLGPLGSIGGQRYCAGKWGCCEDTLLNYKHNNEPRKVNLKCTWNEN